MVTKGEPLIQCPKYDPFTSKYFQLTLFHEFSVESWNNGCSIFDQIEQDDISGMFGSNSPSIYRNILCHVASNILFLIFGVLLKELNKPKNIFEVCIMQTFERFSTVCKSQTQ
jgi:hypothetical protein